MNTAQHSIYRLLVSSEEKGRGTMETILYALLSLSVIVSIIQFVQLPCSVIGELMPAQYLSYASPQCQAQC
jgi:hypothetical protein